MSRVQAARCSVPGKLILAGEHSVVHGRPALAVAVDRRLVVDAGPGMAVGLEIALPDLDRQALVPVAAAVELAAATRKAWEDWRRDSDPSGLKAFQSDDPLHLVTLAAGEVLQRLDSGVEPALRLRVRSELPVGSGLGSSAAVAVGVVAAMAAAVGIELTAEEVESAALEVERRQHGAPSGLDTAVVLRGGLIWMEGTSPRRIEALPRSPGLLAGFRVWQTGRPRETTGEVVAAVGRLLRDSPVEVGATLDALESATRDLRAALEDEDPSALIAAMRRLHRGLVTIGVVPPRVCEIVAGIESAGGAAKISGAGALSDPGAGSLLVYHPDMEVSASLPSGIEAVDAPLGAAGLRREPVVSGDGA